MSPIARVVFDTEVISLGNGDEVTVRPLPIKYMRETQKKWRKLNREIIELDFNDLEVQETVDDRVYDTIVDIASFSLSKLNEKSYTAEEVSEEVDQDTLEYILKVCAKIDVNPKDETTQTKTESPQG